MCYIVNIGRTNKRTRTCSAKAISSPYIENQVIEKLYNRLLSPASIKPFAAKIIKQFEENKKDVPDYLKQLRKELSKVEKEIDNIVNAIAGGMFHPSMRDKMDELENQKKNILTRIAEAEYELEVYNFTSDQVEEYILKFRDIKEFLPEGQKKVVGMLVNKIIVYEDKIDIEIINSFDKRAKTPENEQKNTIATPEENSNSLDLSE